MFGTNKNYNKWVGGEAATRFIRMVLLVWKSKKKRKC